MKKTLAVTAIILAVTLTVAAQQPQPPAGNAAEIQKQIDLTQAHAQIDYNSLRDLVEFQNYLREMGELQTLNMQLQAAKQAAEKPATPPAPAKTTTPPATK
jgi:hypothetical protein